MPRRKSPPPDEPELYPCDYHNAELLQKIIQRKGKINQGWARRTWAVHMARLRMTVGTEAVSEALDWYRQNIGKKGVLKIITANHFRKYWDKLQNCMRKNIATIEISPGAKSILKELESCHWPKGGDKDLEEIVQLSIEEHGKFMRKAKAIAKDLPPRLAFLWNYSSAEFRITESFLVRWFKAVHKNVSNWADWTGDLKSFAFHPKHYLFVRMGKGWTSDYGEDPGRWDKLIQLIEKGK